MLLISSTMQKLNWEDCYSVKEKRLSRIKQSIDLFLFEKKWKLFLKFAASLVRCSYRMLQFIQMFIEIKVFSTLTPCVSFIS